MKGEKSYDKEVRFMETTHLKLGMPCLLAEDVNLLESAGHKKASSFISSFRERGKQ